VCISAECSVVLLDGEDGPVEAQNRLVTGVLTASVAIMTSRRLEAAARTRPVTADALAPDLVALGGQRVVDPAG
jgi:hypothetical protein